MKKVNEIKEIKENIPVYLFNIVEMLIIVILGCFMRIKVETMLNLIIVFIFVRQHNGKQMHYKSLIKCSISTTFLFVFFYLLTYVNNIIAILVAAIAAYSMTENADIKNCFLYSNEEGKKKYREMKKYINECKNMEVLEEFKKRLIIIESTYKDRFKAPYYKIYEMYFLNDATFKEIREELQMYDNHEITKALDLIFMIFNEYMIEINEFKNLIDEKDLAKN